MKRVLILGVSILLASAAAASANSITATAAGGVNFATLTYARTALTGANTGWDELDINISAWLQSAQISAGATANSLGGTFTAVGTNAAIDLPNGTSTTWSASATNGWADGAGSGPKPAPQTYVNMDAKLTGFSRVASGSGYSTFTGNWYVSQDMQPGWNLGPVDTSTGASDDGIDETLLAKVFVTSGAGLTFLADATDGVHGLGLTTGTVTFAFTVPAAVPEPSALALLAAGLLGAAAYGWRKRK